MTRSITNTTKSRQLLKAIYTVVNFDEKVREKCKINSNEFNHLTIVNM
jgi:hypothetical protein